VSLATTTDIAPLRGLWARWATLVAVSAGQTGVAPEDVQRKWLQIAPLIDRVMSRLDEVDGLPVERRSSLAGDDRASRPYQVSHALSLCLMAGVDHLHAAKSLVVNQQVLHLAAPSTLARGALENFAAAYWILGPVERRTRVERALRWHYKNAKDQHTALSSIDASVSYEDRSGRIDVVSRRYGLDPRTLRRGYASTTAVQYCDQHIDRTRIPLEVALPWRICSGLAHGRPWAYLGTLEHDEVAERQDGTVLLRVTSGLDLALYPLLAAMHLLEEFLRLRDARGRDQTAATGLGAVGSREAAPGGSSGGSTGRTPRPDVPEAPRRRSTSPRPSEPACMLPPLHMWPGTGAGRAGRR